MISSLNLLVWLRVALSAGAADPASSGYLFNTAKNESTPPESNCSVIFEWQTISVAFLYVLPFVCSCVWILVFFGFVSAVHATHSMENVATRLKSDISLGKEWINFGDFYVLFSKLQNSDAWVVIYKWIFAFNARAKKREKITGKIESFLRVGGLFSSLFRIYQGKKRSPSSRQQPTKTVAKKRAEEEGKSKPYTPEINCNPHCQT